MSRQQSQERTAELIQQLDMTKFADRRANGFSQGQKTKVALARALVHRPQTLMLDEPTNGLDVMATRGLREIIRQLAADGHCILFSSHIMQEVAALCDHIAIISDGTVAIEDSLDGILARTGQTDLEDAFVESTQLMKKEAKQ
jgi:sodium transport system ATP-binding protein